MRGARAVQKAIIQSFPQADISISIVWVNMLPLDSMVTAGFMAKAMQDPRVCHFHDSHKQVGQIIAQSLGGPGKVAWDVYLFYAKGDEWADSLPPPTKWAHQLQDSWIDPAHYHSGDDLIQELDRAMSQLATQGQ